MRIENHSKEKIDINFLEIINILKKNKINYWMCNGTLLGLIRDKKLIPWDHDIDIALWKGEISKERIKEIMFKNNYSLKSKFLIEDDLLTFVKKGGREVDINFYQVVNKNNQELAYVKWHIPKNNFCKFVDALSNADKYNGSYKYLIKLFFFFKPIFKFIKKIMIKKNLFYQTAGYSQPLDYLIDFKEINLYNINIVVPKKSEEYLKYVYGENWKVPKQKYNWINDSPSTIKFKED
ncbi:MAG: LicD family protein [Pelagibacteraceae bacterium]